MNITEEQREQFQAWIREEHEKYEQFNVQQVRPSLVDLHRVASLAQHRWGDLKPWEISNLGFETQCLIQYAFLLEQKLEQHEARQRPDMTNYIAEESEYNFIQKVSNFFYLLFRM